MNAFLTWSGQFSANAPMSALTLNINNCSSSGSFAHHVNLVWCLLWVCVHRICSGQQVWLYIVPEDNTVQGTQWNLHSKFHWRCHIHCEASSWSQPECLSNHSQQVEHHRCTLWAILPFILFMFNIFNIHQALCLPTYLCFHSRISRIWPITRLWTQLQSARAGKCKICWVQTDKCLMCLSYICMSKLVHFILIFIWCGIASFGSITVGGAVATWVILLTNIDEHQNETDFWA